MDSPDETSANFLLDASLLYKDTCPEVSRFLMQVPQKTNGPLRQTLSRALQNTSVCSYCYQWLGPDNHQMRLRPKQRPSAQVQRILRRQAKGKRLSPVQRNLLQRFQNSCSVLNVPLGEMTGNRRQPYLPVCSQGTGKAPLNVMTA
ncbi:UPF0711 protein C18orf21 homolog [Parambassis ranga]|uniref:UPF0711 protein C18orf21 homolog n=1 Tax=Parambassis ranga TaxID=210632 RepID=A0A6P7I4T9_9TELE|nr:UPF0711 protein C18orf21 homolog [Parambassis ranga]XP_028255444.1 UPF0711 protein C18orf21 homolog [Parambassis ranga]XP_028255445.1 UPF0711 protein C18orf21 homolog [Parambassis ranga]